MKAKYKYPRKRINLRMKIVRLVEKWNKANKDTEYYGFIIGCQVANEIIPFIQNNYRRRKRGSK